VPQDGPQLEAYNSKADELYYGGAAGGGKTDLVLGLAGTAHTRSIIFRRTYPELRFIKERAEELWGHLRREGASYNDTYNLWRFPNGKTIEFGAVEHDKSKTKYQGRPHDLIAFDELPEFLEEQYDYLKAWGRTTDPNQRVRVICAGNPPTNTEGEWVIRRWGAWLDPGHGNKAEGGELRWYVRVGKDDDEREVEDGTPIEFKGEMFYPKSRTFIPAYLSDNQFYDDDYKAQLQALPEPLRSILLDGDFTAYQQDDQWQICPTSHVRAAVERWKNTVMDGPQTGQACDCSRGGKDETVIAKLYGDYFDTLIKKPGKIIDDGALVATWNIEATDSNDVPIAIDMTGGWGSSPFDILRKSGHKGKITGVVFNHAVKRLDGDPLMDKTGSFVLPNEKAKMWWEFREALDPKSPYNIALPDDRKLIGDLCAVRWTTKNGKLIVEQKEDVEKRIHRSTDSGDAVVMAWHQRQAGRTIATTAKVGSKHGTKTRGATSRRATAEYLRPNSVW